MRRTSRVLSRLLSSAVAVAATATVPMNPAHAEPGPAVATLTRITVVGAPVMGGTVTLRAEVTAGGEPVVDGRVVFDAAATEAQLWGADGYEEPYPEPSDVSLGDLALDDDGVASVEITLDTATLPFLVAGESFHVAAEYRPYDGLEIFDDRYATSTDSAQVALEAAVRPGPSIRLFGTPFLRSVGDNGVLSRTNSSADLTFLLRFPQGTAVDTTGTLAIRTTFGLLPLHRAAQTVAGDTVIALWTMGSVPVTTLAGAPGEFVYTSTDPTVGSVEKTFLFHTAPDAVVAFSAKGVLVQGRQRVRLTAQVSASGVPTVTGGVQFREPDGTPIGAPVPLVNGRASKDVSPPSGGVMTIHGGVNWMVSAEYVPSAPPAAFPSTATGVDISGLSFPTAVSPGASLATATATVDATTCIDGDVTVDVATGYASTTPASASVTVSDVTATSPCGVPARPASRRAAADVAQTSVACRPTRRGYACPIGPVAAGSRIRVVVKAPLPAAAAGRRVVVVATGRVAHALDGTSTTLATTRTTVQVPRRTALSLALAPTTRRASVAAGATLTYRLVLRNAGVLRATRVRVCVAAKDGAKILRAARATVRRGRACWSVARLARRASVARTITVKAPRSGRLRLVATAVPPSRQASSVRLGTAVRVR